MFAYAGLPHNLKDLKDQKKDLKDLKGLNLSARREPSAEEGWTILKFLWLGPCDPSMRSERKQGFLVDPFHGRARCSSIVGAFKP